MANTVNRRPVRIQLSRRKGFDLQAVSRKFNGLDAVKVSRPGHWGNPFVVSTRLKPGTRIGADYIAVHSIEEAVETFREFLLQQPELVEEARRDLRGKNLACWCAHNQSCHADVLLELVNSLRRSGDGQDRRRTHCTIGSGKRGR